MRMKDKVVLVTGGAAGIGKATALRFAEEGAKVVICDVNQEAGEATAKELGSSGAFYSVNVASREEVQSWIDDPATIPTGREGYAERFLTAVAAAPEVIAGLDSLLAAAEEAPPARRLDIGTAAAELVPMSGHPTGCFMARLIREQYGDEGLIVDVGNPFAFCRRYHDAAIRSGQAPVWSDAALAQLRSLERRYVHEIE